MNVDRDERPAAVGYRMPAEWQPHRATWLAWPHNSDTWPENLAAAQSEFVRLVETIARGETVCVLAHRPHLEHARQALGHVPDVEWFDIETNDAWIRDYGPTFVVNARTSRIAAVDWHYNGWGGRYPPFDSDQKVAREIARRAAVPCFPSSRVVEGGALEINAAGDLLTTISCLLNFNRNPIPGTRDARTPVAAAAFEQFQDELSADLAGMLGVRSITWLSGAELPGDDTDGHIDQQVRFASDDCVLLARGYADNDPAEPSFRKTIDELRETFASRQQTLAGLDLPLPPPITFQGRTLPASYLNFYICNYGIIVPQFDSPLADARALDVITSAFPGRRVIGLPSLHLSVGLGSFHCLTQQEPLPASLDPAS